MCPSIHSTLINTHCNINSYTTHQSLTHYSLYLRPLQIPLSTLQCCLLILSL
uniref:Uncharacterized protein n=1 Tax=Anguilla anguilla TaxID=7936 RepID=A0A0E9PWD7_ANGAN